MNKKLGPLPVWAWGAIAIAGVLVGLYIHGRLSRSQSQGSGAGTGTVGPDIASAVNGGGMSAVAPLDYGSLLDAVVTQSQELSNLAETSTQAALSLYPPLPVPDPTTGGKRHKKGN